MIPPEGDNIYKQHSIKLGFPLADTILKYLLLETSKD